MKARKELSMKARIGFLLGVALVTLTSVNISHGLSATEKTTMTAELMQLMKTSSIKPNKQNSDRLIYLANQLGDAAAIDRNLKDLALAYAQKLVQGNHEALAEISDLALQLEQARKEVQKARQEANRTPLAKEIPSATPMPIAEKRGEDETQLRTQNAQLRDQAKDMTKQITAMTKEIQTLQTELAQTNQPQKSPSAAGPDLNRQLAEVQQQLKQAQQARQNAEIAAQAAQELLKAEKQKAADAQKPDQSQEIAQLQVQLETQQTNIRPLREQLATMQQNIEQTQAARQIADAAAQAAASSQAAEIAQLQAQVQAAQNQGQIIAELQTQLRAAQQSSAQAVVASAQEARQKAEVAQNERQRELQAARAAYEKEKAALQTQIAAQQEQLNSSKTRAEREEEKNESLKITVQSQQEKIATLQATNNQAEETALKQTTIINQLTKTGQQQEQENNEATSTLRQKIRTLEGQLTNQNKEIERLQAEHAVKAGRERSEDEEKQRAESEPRDRQQGERKNQEIAQENKELRPDKANELIEKLFTLDSMQEPAVSSSFRYILEKIEIGNKEDLALQDILKTLSDAKNNTDKLLSDTVLNIIKNSVGFSLWGNRAEPFKATDYETEFKETVKDFIATQRPFNQKPNAFDFLDSYVLKKRKK